MKLVSVTEIPFVQLKNQEDWKFVLENSMLKAYNKKLFDDFIFINRQLNCIDSGISLAEKKGRDYIPVQQLALSKMLEIENIETVDVDYETAIAYLKKVAINLPDASRGFLLITYKSIPLGWVKNVGNRCNNLYPQNWRIRMNL